MQTWRIIIYLKDILTEDLYIQRDTFQGHSHSPLLGRPLPEPPQTPSTAQTMTSISNKQITNVYKIDHLLYMGDI